MTIDNAIRQARLESELLDKGYTLFDIYGKPDHFIGIRMMTKKFTQSIFKIVFFIVLLYGIWTSLIYLNTAVQTGTLQTNKIPGIVKLKNEYAEIMTRMNSQSNEDSLNTEHQVFDAFQGVTDSFDNFTFVSDSMIDDVSN